MAGLLATLGGNPLNTPVGQKIEQATDASLSAENWTLNMEICDLINETDEGPKDAVKAIKKRLQQNVGKNYAVVLYALTVLETCIKNCGRRFHLLIMQKDFILELVKIIGPKNEPPPAVQERILGLIQSWADAFQSNPEMQGVVQVYQDLKQKGVEFPMTDLDALAPIHTPQKRAICLSSSPQHSEPVLHATQLPTQLSDPNPMPDVLPRQAGAVKLSPEQLAKMRSELDIVQGNMKVFGEMLTELTPGKEHPQDLELLLELQRTCSAMQSRIVDLIDRVGMEEVTNDLLRFNDELNNLFLRYERYEKKRTTILASLEPKQPNPVVPPEDPLDKPLIDFGDSSDEIEQAAGTSNLQDTASKSSVPDPDEFDMFAQSRNTPFDSTKGRGSSYADNTNLNQIEGSLAAFTVSRGNSNVVNSTATTDQNNSGSPTLPSTNAVNRRHMDKEDDNALFAL